MKLDEVYHCSALFSGRVQGVGFRYRALQIAREFEVSGFVRNLADGRVQLEAEGAQEEVEAFLDSVADRLDVFIRKTERRCGERRPHYRGFTIG